MAEKCLDVPLKEYVDARLSAMEQATKLAADALNIRLEHMNQFRQQITEERKELITRTEVNLEFKALNKSGKETLALLISLFSLVAVILIAVFKL